MADAPEWEPITRGKPDVLGVDEQYSGLLDVRIPLSRQPESQWQHFFESGVGVGIPPNMHPPRLSGNTVQIKPPDSALENAVQHVDARIDAANERYQRDVLPALLADRERDQAAQEEKRRRVEDAQRRAQDL